MSYWTGLFIRLVCLWEFALFGNVIGTFWPGLVLNLNVINLFIKICNVWVCVCLFVPEKKKNLLRGERVFLYNKLSKWYFNVK